MLIINARVFTMEGAVIEHGYVRTDGSLITAAGSMEFCEQSAGEEVVDAAGGWLFPGFIDAHCHVGMWEDALGFEGDDGNEDTDPLTPQMRAIDAVNPLDRCFAEALAAGVTTVVTGPGSANVMGGQLAALKTSGRRIDDMVIRAPLAIKMALGENPKTVYHGKNQSPVTRMASAALIREQLAKARRYEADYTAAAEDDELQPPEYDMRCEALLPLLRREIPAHIHAHRCDDLFTAIRLAKEFEFDYILVHATEGHHAADLLAEEGARVLAGPLLCDRSKPEMQNLTPAGPGILTAAGVKTAIVTDHPEVPIQYLALCAGLAVREGMPWEAAVEAITRVPAEICGLEGRVGSIKAGKEADLLLFAGDPLRLEAKPALVICGGKVVHRA